MTTCRNCAFWNKDNRPGPRYAACANKHIGRWIVAIDQVSFYPPAEFGCTLGVPSSESAVPAPVQPHPSGPTRPVVVDPSHLPLQVN